MISLLTILSPLLTIISICIQHCTEILRGMEIIETGQKELKLSL